MQTQRKNDLLRQGSILAVAGIIVRLIGILYRIPMSNMLGEEGNGIYSVAYGIYSVVLSLATMSFPLAVSKLVSQYTTRKKHKTAFRLFQITLIFAVVLGLVAALFLYFGAGWLEKTYAREGLSYPLKIVAPTVFVMSILAVLRGFFQGKNTMVPTAVSQIIEQVINALVSIIAISVLMKSHADSANQAAVGAAGGITGTLAGAFGALLFLLFVYVLCKNHIHRELARDTSGVQETAAALFKALLFTMIPVILSQTVYQIGFTLDDLIFGNIMAQKGTESAVVSSLQGVYNTQYTLLINAPVAVAPAMASSTIPSLAASNTAGDKRAITRKTKGVIKFNMVVAIPSAVGLAVLARPILTLLFPQLVSYRDVSVNLLQFGSISVVFYALSTITSAILQSVDRMRLPVIHGAISVGIHLCLLSLLLQFTNLGVYALLIGHVTLPLVICILNWRAVSKTLSYRQEISKTFGIPLIASAIMGLCAVGSYHGILALSKSNALSVLSAILIALIVYFCSLLRFRCFSVKELYDLPFGGRIVAVAKKLHLL